MTHQLQTPDPDLLAAFYDLAELAGCEPRATAMGVVTLQSPTATTADHTDLLAAAEDLRRVRIRRGITHTAPWIGSIPIDDAARDTAERLGAVVRQKEFASC